MMISTTFRLLPQHTHSSISRVRINVYLKPVRFQFSTISRQLFSTFVISHQKNSTNNMDTTTTKEKPDAHHIHKESKHTHSHSGAAIFHHHHHSLHEPNQHLLDKTSPASRITWIGLFVNIGLAISKGIGGVYFHSQALIADAIHSVGDMIADFLTLATVNVAAKVGTPTKFPLGYGKIESIGSFLVSAILLFAGISIGWSSLISIFEFVLPSYWYDIVSQVHIGHSHSHTDMLTSGDHGHSHSHLSGLAEPELRPHKVVPNINAAWLAGASIIVKEILFRETLKVANQTNSKVLVANAWHHRIDSLTAVVALLTVTGGVLFNVAWLDSVGGIGVSILIIKAGWDTIKEAWFELIDRGEKPGSELYDKIDEIVRQELLSNEELNKFKLAQLSVLSSGANTNIRMVLHTDIKGIDLKMLNKYEEQLSALIKEDDKFVRNIFIQFKEVDQLEDEHTHEHEHTHDHTHSHDHHDHTN